MLANAVDLGDRRPAVDQLAVERNRIGERDARVERQLHHGRGAAADQEQTQGGLAIIRSSRASEEVQSRARSRKGGLIGKRVATGKELEFQWQARRPFTRDQHPRNRAPHRQGQTTEQRAQHLRRRLANSHDAEVLEMAERDLLGHRGFAPKDQVADTVDSRRRELAGKRRLHRRGSQRRGKDGPRLVGEG